LHQVYAPPAPTALTAAGFFSGERNAFAVDLIWQPIDEAGLMTPLAGYDIYREPIDANQQPTAVRVRLNQAPIPSPAFHDADASAGVRYRYSVCSVDVKGNRSSIISTILEPIATN
jgi:hypothetical protein